MDAQSATAATPTARRSALPLDRVCLLLAATAGAVLCVLAVCIVIRRLAGGLQQPLDASNLILTALLLITAASTARLGWRSLGASRNATILVWLYFATITTVVVLVAASISRSESPAWALAVFWLSCVAAETSWWIVTLRRHAWRNAVRALANDTDTRVSESHSARPAADLTDSPQLRAEVTQQLTRARGEHGGELLYGLLRADFQAGERTQTLHVAFCPPLDKLPELTVEQIEGPHLSIKPTQVETFGARLDLRLEKPARGPSSAVVELHVRTG